MTDKRTKAQVARNARYRGNLADRGLKLVSVTVPAAKVKLIHWIARRLRERNEK